SRPSKNCALPRANCACSAAIPLIKRRLQKKPGCKAKFRPRPETQLSTLAIRTGNRRGSIDEWAIVNVRAPEQYFPYYENETCGGDFGCIAFCRRGVCARTAKVRLASCQ